METDTTLIRADRVVVLDPPAALHSNIVIIVFPADTKAHYSVGLCDAAENLILVVFNLVLDVVEYVLSDFLDCLDILRLAWVTPLHTLDELVEVNVVGSAHSSSLCWSKLTFPI